jgi:CheY-like chemotaxis protein
VAESNRPDPRRHEAPASADDDRPANDPIPVPRISRTSLRPSFFPGDPAQDLAGALHEVSNALTVVLGWIERARDARGSSAELSRALDVAADRASLARGIVRRAIGADAPAELPAPVEAVLADGVIGLEPELLRAGIRAIEHVDPAVVGRTIDNAPTVLQILTNLLLNAIALSPSGSTVHVEAEWAPGGVVFAVSDEGPGIPLDRRATLFDAGLSTRAGGAGIGLRHAAALARALGGTLALGDSDVGARFELTWPLTPLPSLRPRPPSSPPSAPVRRGLLLSGTRILLVEDDDAVVDLLDTALTARGADVVSIRHQRELAGALATGPFDAALFDISPIQDDVRGAVASARGSSSALRVVLISGSAAEMPTLPDEWITAWVRKPFEVGEILQAIAPLVPRGSTA